MLPTSCFPSLKRVLQQGPMHSQVTEDLKIETVDVYYNPNVPRPNAAKTKSNRCWRFVSEQSEAFVAGFLHFFWVGDIGGRATKIQSPTRGRLERFPRFNKQHILRASLVLPNDEPLAGKNRAGALARSNKVILKLGQPDDQ